MTPRRSAVLGSDPLTRGLRFYAPLRSGLTPSRAAGDATPTFARGSAGNYVAQSGLVAQAASGAARFDWTDPARPGVLLEPAATNLLLWSRADNAAWVKTSGAATTDATASADGTASSNIFTASGANGTMLQTVTAASAARTFSIYLKRKTGTGTVTITGDNFVGSATATLTSAWQRFTVTATATNPVVGIKLATSGDAVYWDFAQLETGAIATAPVATTTATATRSADTLDYPTLDNLPWQGGVFSAWEYSTWAGNDGADHYVFDTGLSSTRRRLNLTKRSTNALAAVCYGDTSSGFKQIDLPVSSIWNTNGWNHVALSWRSDGTLRVWCNGQTGGNVTTGGTWGDLTALGAATFGVGYRTFSTAVTANARLRDLRIYDASRYSDAAALVDRLYRGNL